MQFGRARRWAELAAAASPASFRVDAAEV